MDIIIVKISVVQRCELCRICRIKNVMLQDIGPDTMFRIEPMYVTEMKGELS
jgi:hypothetical protein